MLDFCRKHDGAISVFLTLILIPTLLFGGVIVDGVRIYGSRNMVSGAGELAMNGALAGYSASLNSAYGLIATAENEEDLKAHMQDYFESTLNANGLTEKDFNKALIQLELMEEHFDAGPMSDTEIWETEVMKQEVLEYMKYRAPVTFVNRVILDKVALFEGIDKEKEALDSQIEFESELEDMQEKFDNLLSSVDIHTGVYKSIPSTSEIREQMQKTKDNYSRMCLLATGYKALSNYHSSGTRENVSLGLLKSFNDLADGCSDGIEGFESLLKMEELQERMRGNPDDLLVNLNKDSFEYAETVEEISKYNKNSEWLADQIEQIKEEYDQLADQTSNMIYETYDLVYMGYESAELIEEQMAEMREKLEKCRGLYEDWEGNISEMPEGDTKTEMSSQAEHYAPFFAWDVTQGFDKMVADNKQYYEAIKNELDAMVFNGGTVAAMLGGKHPEKRNPKSLIDSLAAGASGSVRTQAELSTTAADMMRNQWSWADNHPLSSVTTEKAGNLEDTEFVHDLREELCNQEKGDKKRSKEESDKWDSNLKETLEEYLTLFTSNDIEDIDVYEKGQQDLPSQWLAVRESESNSQEEEIEGNMSSKKNRKKVSDSARNAMNADNSALSEVSDIRGKLEKGMEAGMEAVYITEYIMGMLSYYTVDRDEEGEKQDNPLSLNNMPLKDNVLYRAEVEYVIWGDKDIRDNITKTKALIFTIQFVFNTLFAFTNQTLREEAGNIAILFPVGALGRAAIKAALLAVVSLIETTNDLKQLVSGEKVDLIKGAENWETWLFPEGHTGELKPGQTAFSYDDYLWVFLFFNVINGSKQPKILARTADCIELNQTKAKSDPNNSLRHMYTMVYIDAQVRTDTFFLQKIDSPEAKNLDENSFAIPYYGLLGY